MRFCTTPSSRPPANAIGIDRSPANTTAANEPNTTSVKVKSCSVNRGASSTPPKPASTMVSTQATADVRAALTPRIAASDSRSTTARISSPTRVRRITNHSTAAAIAATMNTANWSEVKTTP